MIRNRPVGLADVAQLPTEGTIPSKIATPPSVLVPVQVGTASPRSFLGPSMTPVEGPVPWHAGESVIQAYNATPVATPAVDPTGGAFTPSVPNPATALMDKYPGIRNPKTFDFVLSTFTDANNTRQKFLQLAVASYLGTTTFPVTIVVPAAGTPTVLFSYTVTDVNYLADSFEFSGMNQNVCDLFKFIVDLNGEVKFGPAFLLDGRADLNILALQNQTINISLVIPTGVDLVTMGRLLLNGLRNIS